MTIHWTCWKEASNVCAKIGKPTLAMLVPSDDSSMASERLARAQRIEGIRSALPATASPGSAVIGFNMNSFLTTPESALPEIGPLHDMA